MRIYFCTRFNSYTSSYHTCFSLFFLCSFFVLSLFFLCFIVSFSLILSGLIEQNGDLTTGTRNTYIAGAGDMIFILFNSLVVIVMLNLLIAILGNTYSRIASHEKVQMQFERARCIYEIERHFMPDFAKRFNKFFPRTKCFFFLSFFVYVTSTGIARCIAADFD